MGPLQTLINFADNIQFDRRKVVGIQFSRSEIAKVSETPTRNAWKINFSVKAGLPYNDYRELLEKVDNYDRRTPDYITFSSNPSLDWITRYKAPDFGSMTTAMAQAMRVQSLTTPTQVVLTNLPPITGAGAITSTTPLFKSGDFIQFGSGTTNPYPFTVVDDVLRGTGNTVTITVHRPVFMQSSAIINQNLSVGSNVTFLMFCTNMPVYSLVPGATKYSNGKMSNNAYIEWSDTFKLYEWTGAA